ncbi:NAD(+)/NADH kinase [bacterium]|jgi:NAD+ kinase|nr:NAD(+)/NADH kinase [bacterium]
MLKHAVVLHHPRAEVAAAFSRQLGQELAHRGVDVFIGDVWGKVDEDALETAQLAICIGGDGTVLRAARLLTPYEAPILGVNMGRLGFLTDMSPRDCFTHVERMMSMDWRVEERLMVRGEVFDGGPPAVYHGLNDFVVSRRSPGRPIYVDVRVDNGRLALYRCDGIIIATPTGSTGYSLSAGGPILAPTERQLVMTPVSAHLSLGRSLVLQPDSVVEMTITSDYGAIVSVDGQEDLPVNSDCRVTVCVSEHTTRFVRFREASSFYTELAEKLEFQMSSPINGRA